MKTKILNYILVLMLCLPLVFAGAFSTPYLENNLIKLDNVTPSYTMEIVFQNPTPNETTMVFQVDKGADWFDQKNFSVIIPPNIFDLKKSILISKPEFVRYNKEYDITFFITESQIKEGPITAAGRVVKSFKVIYNKELTTGEKMIYWFTDNLAVCIIVVLVILTVGALGIIYLYRHFKNKEEPEVTTEQKEEDNKLDEKLDSVQDAEFEDKKDTEDKDEHICTMNGENGECSNCGKEDEDDGDGKTKEQS